MTLRVDATPSFSLVGSVLKYLAVPLCFPLVVALYYGETVAPFLATILVTVTIGVGLERLDPDPDLRTREGFLMVAATWRSLPWKSRTRPVPAHPASCGAWPWIVRR